MSPPFSEPLPGGVRDVLRSSDAFWASIPVKVGVGAQVQQWLHEFKQPRALCPRALRPRALRGSNVAFSKCGVPSLSLAPGCAGVQMEEPLLMSVSIKQAVPGLLSVC